MAVQLVNLTGFQYGNGSEETGINLESFECRYFPEFKVKLQNYQNQTRGFAVPDKMSREVTVQGEISGNTGLMAATLASAITLANAVTDFGANAVAGGFYFDEATVSQGRSSWKALNIRLSSDPLVN